MEGDGYLCICIFIYVLYTFGKTCEKKKKQGGVAARPFEYVQVTCYKHKIVTQNRLAIDTIVKNIHLASILKRRYTFITFGNTSLGALLMADMDNQSLVELMSGVFI